MKHVRWLTLGIVFAALAGGVALVCAPPPQPVVHEVTIGDLLLRYWLVSTQRADRTHFDYQYVGNLTNNSSQEIVGAVVRVRSSATSTHVTDDTLAFGAVASRASAGSSDVFAIQQDRTTPFSPDDLTWTVDTQLQSLTEPLYGASIQLPPNLLNNGVLSPSLLFRSLGQNLVEIRVIGSDGAEKVTFVVLFSPNPSHLSLEDWFAASIDTPLSDLANAGTYQTIDLADGRRLMLLANPVPDAYSVDGGISVPMAILISSDSSYVATIDISHDNDLVDLGYPTVDEQSALLERVAETVQFPSI